VRGIDLNLTFGYNEIAMKRGKTKVSEAASLMGRRSAESRKEQWGEAEFQRRMQEWGKLGGRPKESGQKQKGGR
jgi:hypothetical protein